MPKDIDAVPGCRSVVAALIVIGVVAMGGKPSKGTRKDKRLKENKKGSK